MKNLQFPLDLSELGPYLKIDVFEYPSMFDAKDLGKDAALTIKDLVSFLNQSMGIEKQKTTKVTKDEKGKETKETNEVETGIKKRNRRLSLNKKNGYSKQATKINSFGIYIPPNLGFTLTANWELSEVLGVGGAIQTNEKGEWDASAISSAVTSTLSKGAASALGGAGGFVGKIVDEAQMLAGVTLNPKERLLYKGSEPFRLDLTWELLPQNKEEAEVCEEIAEIVRKAVIPKVIKVENFLRPPNIFNLSIAQGGKNVKISSKAKNILKFATNMIARSVAVNFINDNSALFYEDGRPIGYNITLNLESIFKVFED